MKVCSGHLGHMYGKNPLKIFSRTKRPMALKHGIKHWGLGLIVVCSNGDPKLTMAYFTARSNLVPYAFILEKLVEIT